MSTLQKKKFSVVFAFMPGIANSRVELAEPRKRHVEIHEAKTKKNEICVWETKNE